MSKPIKKVWWKEAVVYQVYPRSFKDSNGDGIGDLRGVISKLDYIADLEVDVVWLNPIYASPNDDNGYDISDYQSIMKEFGTMSDFDELLKGLHDRGIRLIMDLVVNHTSDEHFWFQQSRKSRDNPYRNYYHWIPAEDGPPVERGSFFDSNGSAWKYDELTNAYYLHYFSQKQPDLNWENEQVRKEIYDMMHFWLKKGIDGFRMDVITFISKDMSFPPIPESFNKQWFEFYGCGPKLHDYLQEMNREVLCHYDIMTVAEGPGTTPENVLNLVDEDRKELNMSYHFDHPHLGFLPRKLLADNYKDLISFKKIHTTWDNALKEKGWGTVYLGNHDQARMVSRWADDSENYRELSAKMLNTWIFTMRGTPYCYMGDEIGMTSIKFDKIEDYKDIETINWYKLTEKEGGDLQTFLEAQKITARDNGRTPMQWNDKTNSGFTTGTPWIKVNPNYKSLNIAAQKDDPQSVLNHFKQLIKLRKKHDSLVYGDYQILEEFHEKIYAYTRSTGDEECFIALNFSRDPVSLPFNALHYNVLINNYKEVKIDAELLHLNSYQAVVIQIKL